MALFDPFLKQQDAALEFYSRSAWQENFDEQLAKEESRDLSRYKTMSIFERYQAMQEALQEEIEHLRDYDNCMSCRTRYRRLENLGTHRCRYHPSPGGGLSDYQCCGVGKFDSHHPNFRGCVPCDHTPLVKGRGPRWHADNVFYRIPVGIRPLLPFPETSIVDTEHNSIDPSKSFYIITRVYGYR